MKRTQQEERIIRKALHKKKRVLRTYVCNAYWQWQSNAADAGLATRAFGWWPLKLTMREYRTMQKQCFVCEKVIPKGVLTISTGKPVASVMCVSCFKASVRCALEDIEMLTGEESRKRYDLAEVL